MKSLFLTLAVATVINSGIICAQTSDSQARTTQQNKSPSELPETGLNDHPEAQIPDHILFLLYFQHLKNLDDAGAKLEAEGKNGDGWRTHEQRESGVSPSEGEILKEAAYACLESVSKVDQEIQQKVAAFLAGSARNRDASARPDLGELEQKRMDVIHASVSDLQFRLGTETFNKLNLHINKTFRPSIHSQSVSVPAPGKSKETQQ